MDNIKCILLDIDYTLTKNDGSISDYTRDILKKARDKGILVILCSGRPNIFAIKKSKDSNSSPIVIADNGALIYDYENNKEIYKNEIPKDVLSLVWKESLENDIDCILNSNSTRYRHKKFENSEYIKTKSYIDSISELNESISQIVISSKDSNSLIKFKKYIESIDELEITNTNLYDNRDKIFYFCDINRKGNSKGKAILKLIDILNININDVICFGDSINDVSMFKVCNETVAMKNSCSDILRIAKYITDYTNDEDGVAKFIEQNILNN